MIEAELSGALAERGGVAGHGSMKVSHAFCELS